MKLIKSICSIFLCASICMSSIIAPSIITAGAEVENISVMCLGDSITDGFNVSGGYRYTLGEMLEDNGYSSYVDFVGPNWGGSQYDPQHAGYSGYAIDKIEGQRSGLYSFIDWLMESYPADVVLLQIGTNDILSSYEVDTMKDRLELLVNAVLDYLPEDGMLFLATITPMNATALKSISYISEDDYTDESMDATVDAYNEDIRNLVSTLSANGENIALCDWDGIITKSHLADGVHPSEAGYAVMGEHWYNILVNYMENGTTELPDTDIVYGDANGDGKVNAMDATLIARYSVGTYSLTDDAIARCDVNSDGKINALDATIVARYSVGLVDKLPTA